MKNTPLQQANSGPANDSNPTLSVKPTGLGLSRSASIMSQASHISEAGSNKGRNTVRNFVTKDWLGRSRSQPRLPQYPSESHVSIHSERSSMEDRARSPPNSSSRVYSSKFPLIVASPLLVSRSYTLVNVSRLIQCSTS